MKTEVTNNRNTWEKEYIYQKVQDYNQMFFEKAGFKDLGIYMRNEKDEIIAGLAGVLRGKWLLVQLLWVREDLRRQNIGSDILQKAEAEAKKYGCKHILLDTFEFQAPKFYKKKGFKEVFVYEEHPITGKHYYLSKDL